MPYLVAIHNDWQVVNRSFACTKSELIQEIATACGVQKHEIRECQYYSSLEAAETVAKYTKPKEVFRASATNA